VHISSVEQREITNMFVCSESLIQKWIRLQWNCVL